MGGNTEIGCRCGHFPSTQVSLLRAAAAGLEKDALDRVIAIYRKPVYRYIRLKFHVDSEDAKGLTQRPAK